MRNIAKIDKKDRQALFQNTASKMGLSPAIIEKDFWVCYMLDYLFNRSDYKNSIAFKGGTSLSKSFGLIERFSEDIDLILDWRVLDLSINEPWIERSNTKQDIFNKEINHKTQAFLKDILIPNIIEDLNKELSKNISLYVDKTDPQTVIFEYERSFNDDTILPIIRLEIGALAAWTPVSEKEITPYAATFYPRVFSQPTTEILTLLPERTFWEKITILHREAYRPKDKLFPLRYSRHYYDLYSMANSYVKDSALKDIELIQKVVDFKSKFYRCPWARYDLAKVGSMKLMPPQNNIKFLKDDYEHMQNMIFGEKPTFEILLETIQNLENEINSITN